MTGGEGLSCRMFGGIGAASGGREIALRGPQRRRLVAVLLAAAPRPVSTDRLVALLAADGRSTRTADPANAVQAHVTRLRALLEPGRSPSSARWLRSCPGGYLLEPDSLDLWQYRSLVDAAERLRHRAPTEALASYRRAFELWDTPFGDLATDDAVAETAALLELSHLDHEDDCTDLRLDEGLGGDVADEVVAAARAQPIREHRWAQAMRALFQANRQAEALRLYSEARAVLVDELGLEPGPELREMEQRILHHDPLLLGRPRRSTVRGVPATTFVGRDDELDELDRAVDRHRVVTVVGMGGVGKTRLVLEWLARSPHSQAADWIDLRGVTDERAARNRIATDLGVAGSESEPHDPIELVVATIETPRLLVVDNAEVARGAVADLVTSATAQLHDVRFVVTSRVPIGLTGEVVLPLRPLPVPEPFEPIADTAVELVMDRLGPGADEDRARRLARRFGGIPFPLELVAASGGDADAATAAPPRPVDDAVDSAAAVLAEAVDVALDHVSNEAIDVLWTALLLPDGIRGPLVDAVHGADRPDFARRHRDRLLRELVTTSLLDTVAARAGTRYRGSEPLAQLAARRLPPEAATARLLAMAEWWSTRIRPSFFDPPSSEGRTLIESDHRNVVHVLGRILRSHPRVALDLAARLTDHWDRTGRTAEGSGWIRSALERVDPDDPLRPLGVIALVASSGGLAAQTQHLPLLEETWCRLVEDGRDDGDVAAVLLLQLALTRGWTGDLEGADRALDDVRARAAAVGSEWFAATVERYGALRYALVGDPAVGREQAERAADRLLALDDLAAAAGSLYFASVLGRMAGATDLDDLHLRARAVADAGGAVNIKAVIVVEQAHDARRRGDPAAVALLAEAATLTERAGNLGTGSIARRDLGLVLAASGRPETAAAHLVRAARQLLRLDIRGAALALAGLSVLTASHPALAEALAAAAWDCADQSSGTPLSAEDLGRLEALVGARPTSRPGCGTCEPSALVDDAAELLDPDR